jgi:hypothetical protein
LSPHMVPFFLEDSLTDRACQEGGVASMVFTILIYSCTWKVCEGVQFSKAPKQC